MTTWQAFILGLVQGITEFLPVSSSGHLALLQHYFGFQEIHRYLLFDLFCHFGTLLAVFIFFKDKLISIFQGQQRSLVLAVFVATLPLVFVLPLKRLVDEVYSDGVWLAPCFAFTALLLWLQKRYGYDKNGLDSNKALLPDALVIGLMQLVAVLPGVSRSGSTISTGRLLGWKGELAFTFSFMLAIPAILGGVVLQAIEVLQADAPSAVKFEEYVIGTTVSFIVGYFCLGLLSRMVQGDKLHYFAPYCLLVAILSFYTFGW